jgi:hypothetical protein
MWGGAITRQQLQQTIVRLQSLNEVPELPQENDVVSGIDATRRLSISRENEIASNLAFLSATLDDSLKVMAVCIEERRNSDQTTIRIASNTGDLSAVTSGFVTLGNILEQAARRGQYMLKSGLKCRLIFWKRIQKTKTRSLFSGTLFS